MQTRPLQTLARFAETEFNTKFGRAASVTAAAPGRVNLIGEHIDYNDGFVLPFAIDRYTIVTGDKNGTDQVNYFSTELQNSFEINLESIAPIPSSWTNYLNGVVFGFQQLGYEIPGFDVVIHSDIPIGAGLSSSAALEVATATFLEGLLGCKLSKRKKGLLCRQAEHNFSGVPCGIMDPFASVYGEPHRLLLIDCLSQSVSLINATQREFSFLITDTKAIHQLADGEYALRREQSHHALEKLNVASYRSADLELLNRCRNKMTEIEFRRARHVISETRRTTDAAELVSSGLLNELGFLMYDSHDSLRDDYEVSCDELDFLVDEFKRLGTNQGVFGSRMTGGGFGGCTITLVKSEKINHITDIIEERFEQKFGHKPPSFITTPAQGAHLIRNQG